MMADEAKLNTKCRNNKKSDDEDRKMMKMKPYRPPSWASHLHPIPNTISLSHLPTPIHRWNLPNLPNNTQVWLKADKDPGLTGNLLVERLVGAHIDLVSHYEYSKIGSVIFCNVLKGKLVGEGTRPYVIPFGGSNSLGTWGNIETIREIEQQIDAESGMAFDDIVVACGSGSTLVGLALGSCLSNLKAKVHAFSVCDDPDYFYEYTRGLIDGIEAGVNSHDIVRIVDAQGVGYAMSTTKELKFITKVAETTGVVLDPVYSGKACYGMMKDMTENGKMWEGRKVLFVHTGGLLTILDKVEQMAPLIGKWRQMDIPPYLRM